MMEMEDGIFSQSQLAGSSYSYVALLKFVGPVWSILRFHVLHKIDQGRGEGSGTWPPPGRELENEERVGIQLNKVPAKDCRHVLYEHCACSVYPMWGDEDMNATETHYSLSVCAS